MSESRFENYLRDLGTLVREKATDAQRVKSQQKDDYNMGYLMAWHEIVSLMQSQAEQFDITLAEIGLNSSSAISERSGRLEWSERGAVS